MLKAAIYLILMIIVMTHPNETLNCAGSGLYNWAIKLVPTLLPFMMISSLMSKSGADIELGNILSKPFKKIYGYSEYGMYAVFMGFVCGFPMGAKVVCELYTDGKIDKNEATSLLCFCNNIGPAYFTGIIIPIIASLGYSKIFPAGILPFLFGMYGIPAVYGIILSRLYRRKASPKKCNPKVPSVALLENIKESIIENTHSLIILGGYITFINAMRVVLYIIPLPDTIAVVMSSFMELTCGIQSIYAGALPPHLKLILIMTSLSFGGLSCIMQTSGFSAKCGLSLWTYIKHKAIITLLSLLYYIVII